MDSDYAGWKKMAKIADWFISKGWYNLVARSLNLDHVRLVFKCRLLEDDVLRLKATENHLVNTNKDLVTQLNETKRLWKADVTRLEEPSPIQAWISGIQMAAAKQLARNRELEVELTKMGLLRDVLRNEKAYTLFLEDQLECQNPSDVFNSLPLEKRKEYFERTK